MTVLYVCDREKCPNCHSECEHTTDISHAKNFLHFYYTVRDKNEMVYETIYVELNDDEKE